MRSYPFLCLACCSVLAIAPTGFRAQEQTPPSPDAAFLIQAAGSYGIPKLEAKPWHLRVSFQLFDAQGNETDRGTYEEFSRGGLITKRIYKTEHFAQTAYYVPGGVKATGDLQMAPLSFVVLRSAIVEPIIALQEMQRFVLDSSHVTVTSEYRSIAGASLHCYDIVRRLLSPPPDPLTYCFDDNGALVRYTVGGVPMGDATFENPVTYEGRQLPGDVVIERRGTSSIKAHLESIETVANIDQAFFDPPADATPLPPSFGSAGGSGVMGALLTDRPPTNNTAPPKQINISSGVAVGLLLEKTMPVYPPIAKAARVSGTVILQVTIGTEGEVENLHVVSGPAMLQQAALDAVKTWRYRPYLLNNEPVTFQTTVNVIFTLPLPPPANSESQ